jgi:AraC-like DNA-binding protein
MDSFHISPGKILIEHKMNIAHSQLLSGIYSLNDIARMAGYSDLFAFSKAFRKRFGTAPSLYKKSNHMKNSADNADK